MNPEHFERLERSIEKASRFLEGSRNPDGLWSDFLTLAGESVSWVSGYVGYAMSHQGSEQKSNWLKETAFLIRDQQHANGGWGYGPSVPPDADSTSWCLRFLSSTGTQSPESCERGSRFLLAHQNQTDGGFRTYSSPHDVGRYMGLKGSISFEGWLSSQLCVTAVAVAALIEGRSIHGIEEALNLIRMSQTAEGYWNSYWWSGSLYATVHCMEAIKSGMTGGDAGSLDRARTWIAGTQLADGSWGSSFVSGGVPFWTALALRGLMVVHQPDPGGRIGRGADWLLNHQLEDGSWPSGYLLRIPLPSMKEPWKQSSWNCGGRAINAVISDHRQLFSTATAFSALSEYREKVLEGKLP
jgi:prenyltransferase beta subunit